MMFPLITEDWTEENGVAGRRLRTADRQMAKTFVTAHADCRSEEGVSQLLRHLTLVDSVSGEVSGVAVWWSCAKCNVKSHAIDVELAVWEQIVIATRVQ